MVTTTLLKINAATRADKFRKKLQEHFGERPTQLDTSKELTKAQMQPEETIIKFNDRYTVLLEESIEEIPETCKLKIIIVTLEDDIGRKLRLNIAKFEDEPHHPKAIKTLRDTMNQRTHHKTLNENQLEQKLMAYTVIGDINQDNTETGTITRNEILTTGGKQR